MKNHNVMKNLTDGFTVALAVSLLAACSPKAKEKDVYQVPAPKIVVNGEAMDFKAWNSMAEGARTMDLNDSFDISEGSPVKVDVVSHCLQNQRDISQTFTLAGSSNLKIFSILPDETLAGPIDTVVQCSFELALYNQAGSRHIFFIPSVQVLDSGEQMATLFVRNAPFKKTSDAIALKVAEAQATQVEYSSPSGARALLVCADISFPSITFDNVSNLLRFSLGKPALREQRPADVLRLNPVQNCRVSISQDERRIAVTPSFKLEYPVGSIEPQIESLPFRNDTAADYQAVGPEYGKKVPFTFSVLRMTNSTLEPRWVRLPKAISAVKAFRYWNDLARPYRLPNYDAVSSLSVTSPDGAQIVESESAYNVMIPGGASLALEARLTLVGYQVCEEPVYIDDPEVAGEMGHKLDFERPWPMWGASFELPAAGVYEEYSKTGKLIETRNFSWGPPMVLRQDSKLDISHAIALDHHEFCH